MRRILFLLLIALVVLPATAKVELPEIIGDNMVLQQRTQVKLWGKTKANTPVTIRASWGGQAVTVKAAADGRWTAQLQTPEASFTPYSITLSDGEALTVNNILVGEVWFCSGQSNMEMPLNGFWHCPVLNANEDIAQAARFKSSIRMATIAKTAALTPQEQCKGTWKECVPENAVWFSATAYHFAQSLTQALGVPVGIINCSWGGSRVEGWLPREILETYPDIDLKEAGSKEGWEYLQPMIMYNGMLKPMQNYTVKGFLWYQGESNVGKHDTYAARLATMVELWRKEWGLGELPFYFVEIAPYNYGEGDAAAYLREAQYKAQALIPNSGMICTNDLVEPYERINIHPRNKTDVGKRLSYMALANTYGMKSVTCRGPEYQSMEVRDGKILCTLALNGEGYNRMEDLQGFEIAGEDKVFYPGDARIVDHRFIEVKSDKVPAPLAVRYCFRNFQVGNMAGTRELPMVPFRTDNW